MSSTWSISSSTSDDDIISDNDDKEDHSLLLIIMFGTHFCFFLFTYFWLYPTDGPPKNAIMHRLGTDIKKSRLTGEPVYPSTRLSIREISYISRRIPCLERNFQLSEDDQKTLTVVSEGEVNYLRQPSDLSTDMTMNYGSLIVKRGVPLPPEVKKETKEQIENLDEAAVVEDLLHLRRPEKQKNKKKKTKERMDALDQLTRGESAERIPLFSRIIPDRLGQSRKIQKTASSAILRPERTQDPQPTLEEDKTQERVIKKKAPTSRPTQKPSIQNVDVKKKKSGTLKEGRQLTLREELSLARTMEETTNRNNKTVALSSREPPPTV
ncbi:unnamed protein product [Caenorhabditis nigoni]